MQMQIVQHLSRFAFMCKYQSGYKSGHSTTTALVNIVDDLASILDIRNTQAVLVLLDFSKAFDSVNHILLLQKLYLYYKFSSSATRLLHSYLQNRQQLVKCGEDRSSIGKVQVGVPQGSILGPLLFSIFINDLSWRIKHCHFHLYADDLQLYIGGHCSKFSEVVLKLNADLKCVSDWAKHNSLALNPNKSKALLLSYNNLQNQTPILVLDDTCIEFVPTVNNLGLTFNFKLNWNDHVNNLCQKVNYSLYSLRLIKKFCPVQLRIYLINTLIMPIFAYCDVIYSRCDSTSMRLLEVAFNNCVRYVYDLRKYDHVSTFKDSILGFNLSNYYYFRTAVFIFGIIKSGIPSYLYEKLNFSRSLRTSNINLPVNRKNVYHNSGLVNAIKTWNGLPADFKKASSLVVFKKLMYILVSNIN